MYVWDINVQDPSNGYLYNFQPQYVHESTAAGFPFLTCFFKGGENNNDNNNKNITNKTGLLHES